MASTKQHPTTPVPVSRRLGAGLSHSKRYRASDSSEEQELVSPPSGKARRQSPPRAARRKARQRGSHRGAIGQQRGGR